MRFERGQRVVWYYDHHLNRISVIRSMKTGVYKGLCRHTTKHWNKFGSEQMAWVHFDGNKRQSRVCLSQLKGDKDA